MRRNLFLIGSVLILAGLGYLLGWSNLLTVKTFEVYGVPTQSLEKQITQIADIQIGAPLARIEPRIIESQIEKFDWVKKSSIQRNWINGKVSAIIEGRVAVAAVAGSYIDRSGFIFEAPVRPAGNLPEIIAPDGSTRLSAIELFLSLPDTFASNVSSLTATGNQFLISNGRYGINWGRSGERDLKIKVFNQLIALPENKKISYLDLSNPKSPIVR